MFEALFFLLLLTCVLAMFFIHRQSYPQDHDEASPDELHARRDELDREIPDRERSESSRAHTHARH